MKLSEVVSALSYALDLTEGQPEGHAARTCMIGMKLARITGVSSDDCRALFYALLMKDLGCSSTSAKVNYLFGADSAVGIRLGPMPGVLSTLGRFATRLPGVAQRAARSESCMRPAQEQEKRNILDLRSERGSAIARDLLLPGRTAEAIRSADEHWDGSGHPSGLARDNIPLLARFVCIAQVLEVFINKFGLDVALKMTRQRRGKWFDPQLVDAVHALRYDRTFWTSYHNIDPARAALKFAPTDECTVADEATLDRLANGFAKVVDAKSPWTFAHSTRVAEIASGIAQTMGLPLDTVRTVHRAGLLHDIGKLGVSNSILDKPGKLDENELGLMRRHAGFSHLILSRIAGFSHLAEIAASHHERLDGCGYHRGLTAEQLSMPARILAVADMYEALAAHRPYREDLSNDEVGNIMKRNVGGALCPVAYEGLTSYLARSAPTVAAA